MSILPLSKEPQPDEAEFNAFFPSPYSLSQYTSPKSDLAGADYPQPYTGTRRILVIGTDERYLKTENGTLFSTGNYPVETLVPMYHLHKAGFEFDIAISPRCRAIRSSSSSGRCPRRTRRSPACTKPIWSSSTSR